MRKLPTILAAAAIGLAPVVIFTMAPASAAPICSMPESTGQVTPSPACRDCIVANPPGANSMRVCSGMNTGPPVNTGCVGSANDCANRIAACAAGLGPCPYSYRIKPNSGPDCLSEFTQAGREACEKVCTQPGATGCGGAPIGRLPGGDPYTPVPQGPQDPWGHGD